MMALRTYFVALKTINDYLVKNSNSTSSKKFFKFIKITHNNHKEVNSDTNSNHGKEDDDTNAGDNLTQPYSVDYWEKINNVSKQVRDCVTDAATAILFKLPIDKYAYWQVPALETCLIYSVALPSLGGNLPSRTI